VFIPTYNFLAWAILLMEGSNGTKVPAEFVDIQMKQTCGIYPQKRGGRLFASGTLTNDKGPIVCGGQSTDGCLEQDCYIFEKVSQHAYVVTLHIARQMSAVIAWNGDQVWLTGGLVTGSQLTKTTEIISRNEKHSKYGPNLMVATAGHCLVQLNNTFYMTIGGFEDRSRLSVATTRMFDTKSDKWLQGPDMQKARHWSFCGSMTSKAHNGRRIIVVTGGQSLLSITDSTELFDAKEMQWSIGNFSTCSSSKILV
jgi:hypothetical protein